MFMFWYPRSLSHKSFSKIFIKLSFRQVDKNSDAFVEYDELQKWINLQRTAYMWDTIHMIIRRDDDDKNGEISWPEYKRAHYGQWDDEASIDPVW